MSRERAGFCGAGFLSIAGQKRKHYPSRPAATPLLSPATMIMPSSMPAHRHSRLPGMPAGTDIQPPLKRIIHIAIFFLRVPLLLRLEIQGRSPGKPFEVSGQFEGLKRHHLLISEVLAKLPGGD